MKKLFILILSSLSIYAFSNDFFNQKKEANRIKIPRRFFELEVNADFGGSNNLIGLKDFFTKELVIDINKTTEALPSQGFLLNFFLTPNVNMNLCLKNGLEIGLNTGLDLQANSNISKKLFEFIANGNSLNETISFTANLDADAFAFASTTVGLDLFGFHIKASPTLFTPLLFATTKDTSASFINDANGKIIASVSTTAQLFTAFKFDESYTPTTPNLNFGFDIEGSIERKIFETLQAQIYTRIPLVPGRLPYYSEIKMNAKYEIDGILSLFYSEQKGTPSFESTNSGFSDSSLFINRPFRLGAQVAWRPFGKWCTFGALLGFGVKAPFSEYAIFYPEYKLYNEAMLLNILGINLTSMYMNRTFIHQVGAIINLRVVELDVGISAQGTSLLQSFSLSGAGAYVAVKVGF